LEGAAALLVGKDFESEASDMLFYYREVNSRNRSIFSPICKPLAEAREKPSGPRCLDWFIKVRPYNPMDI
jgi:hypothetical protein